MSKKVYIKTFGCQMNMHDSECIAAILEENNFKIIGSANTADLIIFNTCSVRDKPEQKLYSNLQNIKKLKKSNPDLVIAVIGCVAQQKGEEIVKQFPFVDIVVGPDGIDKFMNYYRQIKERRNRVVDTNFSDDFSYTDTLITKGNISRASGYVTVIKGCNSFCSYCVVPYVRGREHSRKLAEIVEDVKKLISQGVTSITLLGQNIARFGVDTGENFPDLLRSVGRLNGLKRLSFLTSHPRDFSNEIIDCFEEIDVISPMLHLPAQHGSSKILKAMNRGYTREDYLSIIDHLRKSSIWDKLVLTTDVLIGFPGEDDSDFSDLMSLLEEVRYDNSFSFIYSPRLGTSAYSKYGSKVDPDFRRIYVERLMRYQERQKEIALEKNKKLVGQKVELLVEGESEKNSSRFMGRTTGGKVVNFLPKQIVFPGDYIMVKITKAHPTHLKGDICG